MPPGKERTLGFGEAGVKDWQPFEEGRHRGYRTRLGAFPGTDLEIELVHALDSETDELLVRLEQTGGQDRIRRVNHFYRIEKPTSDGGYLLVPHGSGYLIPADMAESMPKGDSIRGNLVGGVTACPCSAWSREATPSTRSWRLSGTAAWRSTIFRARFRWWISTGWRRWENSATRVSS